MIERTKGSERVVLTVGESLGEISEGCAINDVVVGAASGQVRVSGNTR
jgi:hypothetical protein